MKRDSNPPIVRPFRCAECQRYYRDPGRPGWGWCEEFPAAGSIHENIVCHPNVGRQRMERRPNAKAKA